MPDQSQSVQPISSPEDPSRKRSPFDRVEPPKKDQDRFREVLRDKEERSTLSRGRLDEVEEGEAGESIFALSGKLSKTKKLKDESEDGSGGGFLSSGEDEKFKKKIDLSQETRADLAQVNPFGGVNPHAVEAAEEAEPLSKTDIAEIVRQMIDKMVTMANKNETVTTLTLKQPPLFDGALIKIFGFNHAKGEFNVSFEGLNPLAKQLTDQQSSQLALKQTLEERGYVLHIIRTNTEIEPPIETQSSPFAQQERQGQQQDQEESQEG